MWSVLGTLISGFLLLRDFFGYFLPGAVLFAALSMSLDVQRFVADRMGGVGWLPKSEWVVAALAVGACYVLGHLLASIGYMLLEIGGWTRSLAPSKDDEELEAKPQEEQEKIRKCCNKKRKALQADLLFYRYRYPSLFIEHDRRDTVAQFRVGLAIALIASAAFVPGSELQAVSLVVGMFMLIVSGRAISHVDGFSQATVRAGAKALELRMPPERRGVSDARPDPGAGDNTGD